MKKLHMFIWIMLPCLFPQISSGFVENRLQWWEIRLQQVVAEKEQVQKNKGMDARVLTLLDNEISRTKKIISLFETDMKNDGSLTYEKKVVTGADVSNEINKTVSPLFALKYLEFLVNEVGNANALTAARDIVKQELETLSKNTLNQESDEFVARTMTEDIGQNEWKNLSREILLSRLMDPQKNLLGDTRESVNGMVKGKLLSRNRLVNAKELHSLVFAASMDHLRGFDILKNVKQSSEALAGSWSWRRIRSALEKKFVVKQNIRTNMSGGAASSGDTAQYASLSGEEIIALYRYQVKREQDYLGFIKNLVAESSQISFFDDPNLHQRFAICIGKVYHVIKTFENTLSLEKKYQTAMSKRDIGVIRELKKEYMSIQVSQKLEIKKCHGEYSRNKYAAESALKKKREGLIEKLAQQELDALYEHAQSCAGLYEKLRFADDLFARYAALFNTLMKESHGGVVPPSLAHAVTKDSLFQNIENFDRERVIAEYATKKFMRNEVKTALSRLVTLMKLYKRGGIDVPAAPSRQDISVLEAMVLNTAQVRIDAWIMHESNFLEIDNKAVKRLSMLIGRKPTEHTAKTFGKEKVATGSSITVTIQEPYFSLTLPRGWEEAAVGETDMYQGVIKSFYASDRKSSLQLVKLPLENSDFKSISEQWIQKSGCSLIEKRWGKVNDVEYLWILAKDRDRNITETCSVSKDGYALLISGKTSRNQHAQFSEQFRSIINSLQARKL